MKDRKRNGSFHHIACCLGATIEIQSSTPYKERISKMAVLCGPTVVDLPRTEEDWLLAGLPQRGLADGQLWYNQRMVMEIIMLVFRSTTKNKKNNRSNKHGKMS